MSFLVLTAHYFFWHYFLAWRDIFSVFRNLFWFLINFFSLPVLVRTLFAPWRRLAETYPRGFNLSAAAETLVVNTLMRLVGVIIRLIMLVFGASALLLGLFLALLFLILWPLLPFAFVILLAAGLYLIFFK